jgi:hypothetical protein
VRVQKILQASTAAVALAEEMDEVVPVTNTRMWVDTHEGDEAELRARRSSRGSVIQTGLKPIDQFSPRTPGNKR